MGDRRRIIWTHQARNNLDEAVAYIAQDSGDNAVRIMEEAFELTSSLEVMSARGRIVPEIADENIREQFLYKFRLIYQVTEEEIIILAFLHSARDFHRWQQEQ